MRPLLHVRTVSALESYGCRRLPNRTERRPPVAQSAHHSIEMEEATLGIREQHVRHFSSSCSLRVRREDVLRNVEGRIPSADTSSQVLTKRPGRAAHWWRDHYERFPDGWPPGVWLGTSVETQKYAPRLTVLARVPAPVRFVSAEPLLGPIDLTPWLTDGTLHWIIVGGESGPGARPMKTDWVRSIRDQATRNNTPLFLKQLGGIRNKRGGADATVDGRTWHEMPIRRAIPH